MLSIGEFSKICDVSTKTLRYYDETGLLKPEVINPENGYRYYAIEQLKTMLFIDRLKQYHFSLDAIRALLAEDPVQERLRAALAQKYGELQAMMDGYACTLRQMQEDMRNMERGIPIMAYLDNIEVQLTETEPVNILSIRRVMRNDEYAKYIGELFQMVQAQRLTPTGAPMTFHHNPEYDPMANDMEIAVPVKEVVKGTRTLPGMLCAKVVYGGEYAGLTSVYARMQAWIEAEGYGIAEAPYEVYLTDPYKVKPEENVTEVYIPVRKL